MIQAIILLTQLSMPPQEPVLFCHDLEAGQHYTGVYRVAPDCSNIIKMEPGAILDPPFALLDKDGNQIVFFPKTRQDL